ASPVLDANGDPLVPGGQYYVLPHIWPGPGGLSFEKTGNQTCPVSVFQLPRLPLEQNNGKPLVFTPVSETDDINEDTAVEIAFAEPPSCAESGKWLIVNDFKEEYWSVGIGGPQDHEGYQTLTGYFKIHKVGSFAYMFSFLPFVR
uniref:Kunitz-type elastase inhibitor BrEI n=1 Tax=Bauhinia rufa TaxID=390785 RepID=IELK1_BAURF|nr:RecName: Full=Kunitz-type elastase inhibitor BrEI [Bauhinia rufa]